MIHPHTELRHVNDNVGYGLFATRPIPEGTITYVKDSLEIEITPTDYLLHSAEMQATIEKYSYIDQNGVRIVSWDFAKYVNHCCECNTISTGYGFELAIRDIAAGEQITDEYGIFNMQTEMTLVCGQKSCRKAVKPSDFETYYRDWDEKVRKSMRALFNVEQPLLPLIDWDTRRELDDFAVDPDRYRSVYSLRYKPLAP